MMLVIVVVDVGEVGKIQGSEESRFGSCGFTRLIKLTPLTRHGRRRGRE